MAVTSERLVVKVDADISDAEKDMKRLGTTAESSFDKSSGAAGGLKGILQGLPPEAKYATAALAGVAAIAASSVHAFTSYASKVREFQRVTGTSAETASKFTFALDKLGIGSENGAKAMFQLEKRIGTGKDNLASFGVTVARTKDGNLDLERTLYNISDAYNSTRDQGTKAAIVFSAFGRQGQALIPVLQRGKQGLKELFDEAKNTNHILSDEDLARAKKFDLAVSELRETFEGLQIKAGNALTPFLTDITEMISSLIQVADGIGVFDALGTAAQAAVSPITSTVSVLKSFTDTIGLTSSETSKYAVYQKDLADKQKQYNDLVAAGKGHSKQAGELLHVIGLESRYLGQGQDDLAKAMQTAAQKAQEEQRALDELQGSLLGLGDATRGPQQALIGFQQSQIKLAESQDTLNDALAKGSQQGESQAQFYRRIQGLQLDVQQATLGVASAHDAVAAAGLKSVDAQRRFEEAIRDPKARKSLIADLRESIRVTGDATGATQALIDRLVGYNKTPVVKKRADVDTAAGHAAVSGLQSHVDSFHGKTVQLRVDALVGDATAAIARLVDKILHPGRAAGGPVSANHAYVVGEKGPELFVPGSSGTIIPNDKVTARAVNASGGATYNIVVNTPAATPDIGRILVTAIQAHERASGTAWRN